MKNSSNKNAAFNVVNEQVLSGLKNEGLKWFKPWRLPNGSIYSPCNWVTGRAYNGINALLLSATARAEGYTSGEWATYKQISENGGNVLKGSKGTGIVYWVQSFKNKETSAFYPTEKALNKAGFKRTDEVIETIWSLRYFKIFNLDQTEGLESKKPVNSEPVEVQPIPQADDIYNNYPSAPKLKHGGNEAFYSPAFDKVQMPEAKYFVDVDSYYKTLFHELIHSTGHESRLKREGVVKHEGFGSETYSKEELVAEIGAWYLAGLCNLDPKDGAFNSQAYINGWVKHLENKEKEVVYAMGQAQKAVAHILEGKGVETPEPTKKASKEPVLASNQVTIQDWMKYDDLLYKFVNHSELITPRVEGQVGANVKALTKHLEAQYQTEWVCEMVWSSDAEYKEAKPIECIKVDGVNFYIYKTSFGGEVAIGYSAINTYQFVLLYRDLTGEAHTFKFKLESAHSEAPIQRAINHATNVCEKNFWGFVTVVPYEPKLYSKQVTIYTVKENMEDQGQNNFFSKATLKFFGQRLSDFRVFKIDSDRVFFTAPSYWDGRLMGYTENVWNFETGALEGVTYSDEEKKNLSAEEKVQLIKERTEEPKLYSKQVTIIDEWSEEIVTNSISGSLGEIAKWFELATDRRINCDSEDWAILEKKILKCLIKNSK